MSVRGAFVRSLVWTGIVCAAVLAVVGGLALRGPGLVAVGVGGLLAACTATGLARESAGPRRRSVLETGVRAACWTVAGLLVLAGISAVAGGVVAVLCVAAASAVLLIRYGRSRPAAGSAAAPQQPSGVLRFPAAPTAGSRASAASLRPVAVLTTAELGQEWTRTTTALAGRLEARVRAALVHRRADVLDELERRDPDGFLRWMTAGPGVASDPSDYVRGGPLLGGSAESDAA